jgi:hypothetical protein
MWGIQLARYRGWILQGATHEQWNEISTMLRKRQYAAFIVYKKGKPVDVRWIDQYKPATKLRIQEDADGWFKRQWRRSNPVVPIHS